MRPLKRSLIFLKPQVCEVGASGGDGDAVSDHYRPRSRPEPSPSLRRYGERVLASAQPNVIENKPLSPSFERSVTELVRQAERFAMTLAQYLDSAARTRTKNGSKKGTVSQSSPPYSSAWVFRHAISSAARARGMTPIT
ncbi:hypothetical protein Agau_P100081 (plasmid) [Agrobacterium tumefaciens F2]|nr:hypothetical protein Agau_P100081 [Agrobacterium tumefaciens F2]